MAQLGRISGPLLEQNLRRDGVDIKFSNTTYDSTSLLYINVNDGTIGVKTDTQQYDLDINNDARTTNLVVDSRGTIDNIVIQSSGLFSTVLGPIHIQPQTAGSLITLQRMRSDELEFNDNTISGLNSNQSIDLVTSGTGTVEISTTTNVYGDVRISGNTVLDGNLSAAESIILGDQLLDTVTVTPDLTQDIIPGKDNTYSLGSPTDDSSTRRWNDVYITDNMVNTDNVLPLEVRVSDQMKLDGVNNEIFALQSNDDIILSPDTQINYIEDTRWRELSASSTAASITGTTLTVAGTITGSFVPGMQLTGVGISAGTVITGTSTGSDSSGTYTVNLTYDGAGSNPAPTGTISITGTVDVIENLTDVGGALRYNPETPLSFASTGIGYLRFMGTNGFIIPAGGNSDRPTRPELGDTRWNVDLDYLEAFAGQIEAISATGNIAGLIDQSQTVTGTTDGYGENASFNFIISSSSISISIVNAGQGYLAGDTIVVPGTVFTGGASPTNDVTITVGAQTTGGYRIATGGGAEVTIGLMEELGDIYSLILG